MRVLSQHVVNGIQREDAESLLGICGIGGNAGAVLVAVFHVPLERVASKNEHAPIVLAVVVEFVVPRHDVQGATTQSRVEVIDAGGHLHTPAFEGGSELVVQLDDPGPFVGAV